MGTAVENILHKPYPLFLLGLGVITAYIPGIFGAAISTGWLFLLIVAPLLLFYCDIKLSWGFVFLCYATLSLAWTKTLNIAWFYLLQLVVLSLVFCIGQSIKINQLKTIFKGLSFGLGLASLVAIAQYFKIDTGVYSLTNSIASIFINPNIYSELSAVLLVSLVVLRLFWWIPVTLPGLILVHSRASLLALGIGLFVWGWQRNKYLALGLLAAVGLASTYFYYDHFSLASIRERLDIWQDTIQGFKLFGNGVGSYEVMFPDYATHINTELARPKFAHNDLLQFFFEYGIGSFFLLMVLFNVFKSKLPETIILYTIGVVSLFTYPLHIPAPAFIAFLVAGYISGNSNTNGTVRNLGRSTLFAGTKTK